MKRMNEVFELPVISNDDDDRVYENGSRWHICQFYKSDKSKHAAIAINNVDKLADALEESLAMLFIAYNLHYGTDINDPAIAKLRAVLDDYRGEK